MAPLLACSVAQGVRAQTVSRQDAPAPQEQDASGELQKDGEQETPDAAAVKEHVIGGIKDDSATETHANLRPNARTMALQIPAPRGAIVDRHGFPLAQTKVAYQLALRFGQFENEDRDYIVQFARQRLEEAHEITQKTWEFSDTQLWEHYRNRRWLALPLTNALRPEEAEKIKEQVDKVKGLELLPIYIRFYPEAKTAASIIGYLGVKSKLPTGPINNMDPLWEVMQGNSGLEKEFDSQLLGKPGVWRLMFNEKGEKVLDELQVRPKPGGALVTTLDLKWQKKAEEILEKRKRCAAMVVLDCKTGEVLVMASVPSFDPNLFIPNISDNDYKALIKDPDKPMLGRAYQGVYPPASTFKTVVVLAALANGSLTENQLVHATATVSYGTHTWKNHVLKDLGLINCIRGLALSNNPFMVKVTWGLDGRCKGDPYACNAALSGKYLIDAARALGFGKRTGLPVPDSAGNMPYDDKGRKFHPGDIGHMGIGQGILEVTPLQMAHSVAGIANGYGLPKLHLIKQIQDQNANVIYAAMPEIETPLTAYEQAAVIVRKGMLAVMEGGTGSRSKLSYVKSAGKTGTGQWVYEGKLATLGWFAGFFPYDNPRFAYAALYEGLPGETNVGGSRHAAPMIKEFFEAVKDDVQALLKPVGGSDIPIAEPDDDDDLDIRPVPVPQAPSGLPDGLYNPDDEIVPIPANAIPVNIDDSADAPVEVVPVGRPHAPREATDASVSMYPRPGDEDYIPGLEKQIPRNLIRDETEHRDGGGRQTVDDSSDIPVAVPDV